MLVGYFSPNKKRQAWGSVRLETMRHSVPREVDAEESCVFPVVQCRLGACVSHIPLGPVSPPLDTRLQSLYCVLGPHALGREGPMLALQK